MGEMTFITHVLSRRPESLSGPLLADTYVTMMSGRNAWYGRQLASGVLTPADGDIVPGKGHIQGPSAVRAFASLLACARVPLGSDGTCCPAIELLPTLRGLDALLFEGAPVNGFIQAVRAESQCDPAEKLLSRAVYDGLAFIPTLLAPEAVEHTREGMPSNPLKKKVATWPSLAEPFLPDDRLAAIGIDVESMDNFRRDYLAFRAGEAMGASGEAVAVARAA